jgi:two-component system, NarL family, sensor histidine kinase NreB
MMKIGTKLGIGIGTLLALCVVIGLVSYTQTQLVRKKLEEVTRVKEPTNSAVYELENNLVETAFSTLGYFATGDPKLNAALERNRQSFEENQKKYAEVIAVGSSGGTERDVRGMFTHLYEMGAEQVAFRDQSAAQMRELLKDLNAIDRLLTERIQKSISVDDPLAYKRLQAALEMQVQVNAIMKGIGSYLLTGESQYVSQFLAAEREFRRFFKVYQIVLISSQEKVWATELRDRFTQSLDLAGSIVTLQQRRTDQLNAFMIAYRELGAVISGQLKSRTEQSLASAKEDLLDAGQAANSRILGVLLLGVLFGVVAGVVTTRQITRPLLHLVSVMNAVAKGDRLKKVELASSDEFHQLGDSFNQMTGQLVHANEELRLLAHTLTSMNESVIITDTRNAIILVNPAFVRTYGYQQRDVVGKDVGILRSGITASPAGDEVFSVSRSDGWTGEVVHMKSNGNRFPVLLSTSVVRDEGGTPIALVGISRDITEQQRLQNKLAEAERERLAGVRAFAASVQRGQEEERRRISRELHDDLCQRLSGMKFRVEVMEDDISPTNKRVTKQLRDFTSELDRSISEVRRISSNLRPSVLDDFGLVTALRLLAREFQTQHTTMTTLDLQEDVPAHFDGDIEIALYRIAQEAFANIARYAAASAVTLSLGMTGTTLTMRIHDNGKGFTPDDVAAARGAGHGAGLMGMRERTELLGGTFNVLSAINAGTNITVILPLPQKTRHGEDENTHR